MTKTIKPVTLALYVDGEWKEFTYDRTTQEFYEVLRLVNYEQLTYKLVYR